jgi:hypothetical protein
MFVNENFDVVGQLFYRIENDVSRVKNTIRYFVQYQTIPNAAKLPKSLTRFIADRPMATLLCTRDHLEQPGMLDPTVSSRQED